MLSVELTKLIAEFVRGLDHCAQNIKSTKNAVVLHGLKE